MIHLMAMYSKLTVEQIRTIKERRKEVGIRPLAEEYGVSRSTIIRVTNLPLPGEPSHRIGLDSRAKITPEQAREIKKRLRTGKESQKAIAEDIGCSAMIISDINLGHTWRWV